MSVVLNPYLQFQGSARAAMEFYHSVFGGELQLMTFAEMPEVPGLAESEAEHVMHGQLTAPDLILMAADIPSSMGAVSAPGAIAVSLSGSDEATLRAYWDGLSAGGTISVALAAAPWGDIFGMFTDRFGVPWLVNIAGASG